MAYPRAWIIETELPQNAEEACPPGKQSDRPKSSHAPLSPAAYGAAFDPYRNAGGMEIFGYASAGVPHGDA